MMKLTRKWRRPRRRREKAEDGEDGFFLPTRDDSLPIDTEEQEEIVRNFERNHAQHSLLWRNVFAALLLAYVVFLGHSIIQQCLNPWELRYHAYFMEEVESWLVILADVVAVVACLLAIKGLYNSSGSYRQWLWYSCYTSLFLAVFWLYHMTRLARFRWDIIWLPFGPLSGAGICLYVDHLLLESSEDIRKLRQSMYNYKVK